jgi:hypothetical protein
MRTLLDKEESRGVAGTLQDRLLVRWTGGAAPIPFDLKCEIKFLSQLQIAAFQKLGNEDLIGPAFELFTSGSLTSKRMQYMTKEIGDATFEVANLDGEFLDFEPDGPAFFFWAEFAFLASYAGFESDTWKQILPFLLRSERIFALCYGQPENGSISAGKKFADYNPEDFGPIHPCDASQITRTLASRFDELEREATECARFAFPGEF